MPNTLEVSSYRAATEHVVHDVFEAMLDYPVEPSLEDYAETSDLVTAAIVFAGLWQGAGLLECNQAQALFFTARLTRILKPIRIDDDVRDSMGDY